MNLKTLMDIPPWDWPVGIGKKLLDVLRDDKVAEPDRLVAAELAGDSTVINDELVEALLSILPRSDRTDDVRSKAAISLGPVLDHADTEGFEDPDDVQISEQKFHRIQDSLHKLYRDAGVPKEVRRRILEASVRAPQNWHQEAVLDAYSSDDEAWRLTAVFCMRFVRGFDAQVLEALGSKNPDIHYESVRAAGNWELDAAWPHIAALVTCEHTEKPLLLAAIAAAASIRPHEAGSILVELTDSDDEDVAEAVDEAMAMGETIIPDDFDDDEDDELIQ